MFNDLVIHEIFQGFVLFFVWIQMPRIENPQLYRKFFIG